MGIGSEENMICNISKVIFGILCNKTNGEYV